MSDNRPSYHEVREVISAHAADLMPLFADGWERFPQGQAAATLIEALRRNAAWWEGRKKEAVADRITAAANEIQRRAG